MNHGQRDITLRFLAEPSDVNFGGKVHGGAVMKWIDLAAYAGGIRFVAPIHVGHLVEVNAKIIYTGKSSMHVAIDVQASAPTALNHRLTTHCIVIMVAVDEEGKPTSVPEWCPVTKEDIALRESAIRLMNMRTEIGEEMEAHVKYLKVSQSEN